MQVIVTPDIHNNIKIIEKTKSCMRDPSIDKLVILGDLVDSHEGKKKRIANYKETMNMMKELVESNKDKILICKGNHDVAYFWDKNHMSNYNSMARSVVVNGLNDIANLLDKEQIQYVHKIDNVLFSHAGISQDFCERFVGKRLSDVDYVVDSINSLSEHEIWTNNSPIWFRPSDGTPRLYKNRDYLQVVGHTPIEDLKINRNVLDCDLQGKGILLLNTQNFEYELMKI